MKALLLACVAVVLCAHDSQPLRAQDGGFATERLPDPAPVKAVPDSAPSKPVQLSLEEEPQHPGPGPAPRPPCKPFQLTLEDCPVPDHLVHCIILPEQKTIQVRDPSQLRPIPVPPVPSPRTVTDLRPDLEVWNLSLDEAIKIALVNAKVVRVLAGITAAPSGSTIYDTAIINTTIDQERARFDPVFGQENSWNRIENPEIQFDRRNPGLVDFTGTRIDQHQNLTRLTQTNVLGGVFDVRYAATENRFTGPNLFPLNPEKRDNVEMSYTQPLLQGGGLQANLAPVVVARINTERSFFQYKDSVQELVRGTIEGYWNLVAARTTLWASRIQYEEAEKVFKYEQARKETGFGDVTTFSQARVLLNQFKATVVQAQADVLNREAALRNLLFLPPTDSRQIVPTSSPTDKRLNPDWEALKRLAEQRRPDIVELKLVLEADQVLLAQAQNQAQPRLDAFALYRWNGLSGVTPVRDKVSTDHGQFTDWTLGVRFEVPLGLRQGRALARQQELIVVRDRANLDQGLHGALHDVALTVRDMASFFEQYEAFKETREAATATLVRQREDVRAGRNVAFLNLRQAIIDWGNAVSSEAQTLLNYNVSLATLEQRTGTILESHNLVFYEERFQAAGPLGLFGPDCPYPLALPPGGDPNRYPPNPKQEPAENYFDLKNPADRGSEPKPRPNMPEQLPPPRPAPR